MHILNILRNKLLPNQQHLQRPAKSIIQFREITTANWGLATTSRSIMAGVHAVYSVDLSDKFSEMYFVKLFDNISVINKM